MPALWYKEGCNILQGINLVTGGFTATGRIFDAQVKGGHFPRFVLSCWMHHIPWAERLENCNLWWSLASNPDMKLGFPMQNSNSSNMATRKLNRSWRSLTKWNLLNGQCDLCCWNHILETGNPSIYAQVKREKVTELGIASWSSDLWDQCSRL